MAVYLTYAALVPDLLSEEVAAQLTRDDDSVEPDEDRIGDFIVRAESLVNGYVGAYYDLDAVTASPPALLGRITADITIYELYKRRPGALNDDIREAHKVAMQQLRDISRGTLSLGVQPHRAPDSERLVRSGGTARRFTRADLESW